ncbi:MULTISPECIES: hypothetical protein [unclassified Cupriavidus]|uniref:hypothetical protein n=1 Tax=unclassified Cupriavidus TaxID=2640874 RepID=UPI00257EECD5|nr:MULTISPECIES: hypothetical protein [unclassified Cupriavidus]
MLAALLSFTAAATTLSPIQLLNPAGSTIGQAILSTGPSTPPVWGGVTLSSVTGTLAVANGGTGATTAANARTNLGAAATSGNLSQFAATTSAQLAGILSDETGTGAAVFAASPTFSGTAAFAGITATSGTVNGNVSLNYTSAATQRSINWTNSGSPRWFLQNDGATESGSNAGSNLILSRFSDAGSFISNPVTVNRASGLTTLTSLTVTGAITPSSTAGIVGTTTNDNANAGSVGEYATNSATSISMTSGTPATVTSLSLTAGDWDVSGAITYSPAASTTVSSIATGISTVAATLPANNTGAYNLLVLTFATGSAQVHGTQVVRVSVASTTTVYLVGSVTFGVSTLTANGFIRARRVR